ncbi:ABC transporter ATP-binding protein [Thermosediminibacter oceani]|uniref:ABC transporter related protein n=1 Tax=Thermosediminibacter oceani (strain ATCC BAA-1034 / DSM 16646 / JW/IW-1228P) TaxID=555079 RepID=D9RYI4_THEOJ|nr:ABC transporter ATP-binding protein [Thermosediminibacter oceani]ADL08408.1 ABC transporter related protein [Thermosediminibacter oceani DSM 16646]
MSAGPGGPVFTGRRHGGRGFVGGLPMVRPAEKPKDFKGTLGRLIKYLKPYAFEFFIVLILVLLSTVFNILGPKIMGEATTKLFEGLIAKRMHVPGAKIDFEYIAKILFILAGLYASSALFTYIQQYIMVSISQKTVLKMRNDVVEKLSKLPLKYFDSRTHGEILSRITNDIDNVSSTLQQSIIQLISAVVTIIGIVVMMLTINPVLTLITFVTLPLSIIATMSIAAKSQKLFAKQQRVLGELNGHVEETYGGHNIVKAFNREKDVLKIFNDINEELYNAAWKAQFMSGVIMPVMNFINNIGYVIVCVVGGIFVIKKILEIGDVQAFIQYSRQFNHPITQTANIVNIIQSTIASAERVFEILDEEEEVPDKAKFFLNDIKGKIKFENVKFSYKQNMPLIDNLNIEVSPGQTVAIVGPTGAGKTTLVNLLMRFYEIQDGRITIDGVDIRDISRANLRKIFGMVLQDTWLFSGTIKENIAYGKEGATDEEIIKAAKAAHAHHFIKTLPGGYDTLLNEEASNISQGQKQLITIARAFLADPEILILDEATSNVDTLTEIYIQKAMKNLMKGRTSFVIAHRLSTIKDADIILVVNNGKIIEKGTHKELLDRGGFYAELYKSQFLGAI